MKYIGNAIKNFGIEKLSVCDAVWYLIDKYVAIFSDILAEQTCMYNKIGIGSKVHFLKSIKWRHDSGKLFLAQKHERFYCCCQKCCRCAARSMCEHTTKENVITSL